MIGGGVVAVAAAEAVDPEAAGGVAAVAVFGGLLLWLVATGILLATAVHPSLITDRSVRLTNVHPEFAAAHEAMEADREEADAARRAVLRAGRARRERGEE